MKTIDDLLKMNYPIEVVKDEIEEGFKVPEPVDINQCTSE